VRRKTPAKRLLSSSGGTFPSHGILCTIPGVPEKPVAKRLGKTMRKGTILLAAIFALGITTTADAARKKKAAPKPDPAIAAAQQSALFISDAFQPWQPQRTMAKAKPAKKAMKAKKKKSKRA
jgi:hypothetical protein